MSGISDDYQCIVTLCPHVSVLVSDVHTWHVIALLLMSQGQYSSSRLHLSLRSASLFTTDHNSLVKDVTVKQTNILATNLNLI